MTREKKKFVSPRVLNQVEIRLERDILQGSMQYKTTVRTMGQELGEEMDFTPSTGNEYTATWDFD